MKRLIIILALSALACGQMIMVEPPKPKRASIPKWEAPTSTAIPKRELCGAVNVRANPAPTGKVLRWLVEGQEVEVIEERGGWAMIGAGEWITAAVLCPK
jgi:hypothetical protein